MEKIIETIMNSLMIWAALELVLVISMYSATMLGLDVPITVWVYSSISFIIPSIIIGRTMVW